MNSKLDRNPPRNRALIAGAGQFVQRPEELGLAVDRQTGTLSGDLARLRGPIELMTEAARTAAEDAGNLGLLTAAHLVGVVGDFWRYRNPAQVIAEQLDCSSAQTLTTAQVGTAPLDLLATAVQEIEAGHIEVAVILGGHAGWSRRRLKQAGLDYPWNTKPGDRDPLVISSMPNAGTVAEIGAIGSITPLYAIIEDSLRQQAGRTVAQQQRRAADLWAAFSTVAESNPFAWDRTAYQADDVLRPSSANRMISFPYTKRMVANNSVDAASALIVCSTEAADRFGVGAARRVYPTAIARAHEAWRLAERPTPHSRAGLVAAAEAVFEAANTGPEAVAHVDLYACFPSIVQMTAAALGYPTDDPTGRALTVTGGLGLAGAAFANAVGHSLAAMVEQVRHGGTGLVHGNAGTATQHAFGLFSPEPPVSDCPIVDAQDRANLQPRPVLSDDWSGPITIDGATVSYGRRGPDRAIALVSNELGAAYATSTDPDLMHEIETNGIAGRTGSRTATGELQV